MEQFDAISAVLEKQAGVEPLLKKVTNIMVIDVKTSSSKFFKLHHYIFIISPL